MESNDESLSIKVNGNRVEMEATQHKRFPRKGIQGLANFEELKSVLHSVMSIPSFMQFIEENLGKRSGIVNIINHTYKQTRTPTNHVWEPGGVKTISEKMQPFDRIVFELNSHLITDLKQSRDLENNLHDLNYAVYEYIKRRRIQNALQKTSNCYKKYEIIAKTNISEKYVKKKFSRYLKSLNEFENAKKWTADLEATKWKNKFYGMSIERIDKCTRCEREFQSKTHEDLWSICSIEAQENVQSAINNKLYPTTPRNFKCNNCGSLKGIVISNSIKNTPEILCVRIIDNGRNIDGSIRVPKKLSYDGPELDGSEYKLASAIIQSKGHGGKDTWVIIYDGKEKCIVKDKSPISIHQSHSDHDEVRYRQMLFYEKVKINRNHQFPSNENYFDQLYSCPNEIFCVNTTSTEYDKINKHETPPSNNCIDLVSGSGIMDELLQFDDKVDIEIKKNVLQICNEFSDVFLLPESKLTHTNAAIFHLPMKAGSGPINIKQFRSDSNHKEMIREMIKDIEFHDVIEHSFSPYNFPIFLRPKPELDKHGRPKMRMCVDFSKLNEQCVPYYHPLPRIDEIQEQLHRKPYICSLDMTQGYHQVLVAPEDREKLAFTFDGVHWQYKRVPFGLSTISGFFQAMMNNILSGLIGDICFVYVDDIVIMAESPPQMIHNIRQVFERLRKFHFKLNAQKCKFARNELKCLGLLCSPDGMRLDPERIEKIKKYQRPQNKKKLQQWLGLANHYRKFIKNFADISEALTTEPVILTYPDTSKPFEVFPDALGFALGAILEQEQRVVCYASRTLSTTERRYPVSDLEQLAVVFAVENWRHFLTSGPFKVYSDHRPLAGELRKRSQSSRLMRYKLRLSEFNFEVIYRKGKDSANADALSRIEGETENSDGTENTSEEPCDSDEIIMVIMVITRSKARDLIAEKEMTIEQQTATINAHPSNSCSQDDVVDSLENEDIPMARENTTKNVGNNNINHCRTTPAEKTIIEITDEADKLEILHAYHDSPFGGHFGCNKTYERIKREYYWLGMKREVTEYVTKCIKCQLNKKTRATKMPLQITQVSQAPFEKIYIDIVEGLPETNRGNNVILSMIDDLTRFVELAALPDQRAPTIAKALFEDILCRYTFPKEIISDQGRNFIGKVIEDMCKMLKIKKGKTSGYHTQSNVVERSHQWLGNYLRTIVDGWIGMEYYITSPIGFRILP